MSPPKPNTYHRYKPFCLKDHILLVKKKSFPGNITFWTEMAILTLIEISYIFILAGLGPKLFVFQSWTQRQSCRAHKIGQFCHQDRPSIPLCSKVRDRARTAFKLAPKWEKAANRRFCKFDSIQPYPTQGQLDWSTLMFIKSPFHGYPTCLLFGHLVWWSTSLGTARTTRRRGPGGRWD